MTTSDFRIERIIQSACKASAWRRRRKSHPHGNAPFRQAVPSSSKRSPILKCPILPPQITIEQAKKLVSSIIEGYPNRGGMIRGAFKDALESFLPHKNE